MGGGVSRYRGWLIVGGIVAILLALPLLGFRMKVLMSRMGLVVLLLGAGMIVLARMGRGGRGRKDS